MKKTWTLPDIALTVDVNYKLSILSVLILIITFLSIIGLYLSSNLRICQKAVALVDSFFSPQAW